MNFSTWRASAGLGIFVLGGGLTLGMVLVTVSVQAIRAVLSDPVEALRYE